MEPAAPARREVAAAPRASRSAHTTKDRDAGRSAFYRWFSPGPARRHRRRSHGTRPAAGVGSGDPAVRRRARGRPELISVRKLASVQAARLRALQRLAQGQRVEDGRERHCDQRRDHERASQRTSDDAQFHFKAEPSQFSGSTSRRPAMPVSNLAGCAHAALSCTKRWPPRRRFAERV